MKTQVTLTPTVVVKPMKVGIHFYGTPTSSVIAIMRDNPETKEYDTLAEVMFKDVMKEFINSEDDHEMLDRLADQFEAFAMKFRMEAVRLRKDFA